MKPYEIKLIAKLLELAADQFSNHGCNDLSLIEQCLTPEEAYQVNSLYAQWNSPDNWQNEYLDEELRVTHAIAGDSGLMRYFAHRLKKSVEDAPKRSAPEYSEATPEHLRTNTVTRWG